MATSIYLLVIVTFLVLIVVLYFYNNRTKVFDNQAPLIEAEPEPIQKKQEVAPEPTPQTNFHAWWCRNVGLSTDRSTIEKALSVLTLDECAGARLYLSYQARAGECYCGGDMRYQSRCEDNSFAYSQQLAVLKDYCSRFAAPVTIESLEHKLEFLNKNGMLGNRKALVEALEAALEDNENALELKKHYLSVLPKYVANPKLNEKEQIWLVEVS